MHFDNGVEPKDENLQSDFVHTASCDVSARLCDNNAHLSTNKSAELNLVILIWTFSHDMT